MTRKIVAALAIVMIGGIVVAVVRAQESTGDSVYSSGTAPQRSVLKRPANEGTSASTRVGTALSDRDSQGPQLVDRLKQIRGSVVGDGRATAPSTLSPPRRISRAPASAVIGDSTSTSAEPRLLGGHSAAPGQVQPPGATIVPRTVVGDSGSARRPRSLRTPTAQADEALAPSVVPRRPIVSERLAREPLDRPFGSARINEARTQGTLLTSAGPALLVDTRGPDAVVVGREAEFKVTLTNQGTLAAHDVFVRVALPTWVEVVLAEETAGDVQVQAGSGVAQELIWRVSQFAAGSQEVLSMSVIPRENQSFNLSVDWTLRPASATTQIRVQQPELKVDLVGPRDIRFGESADYTIRISNPGTGEAQDVKLDFEYGPERLPTKLIGNLAAGEETEIPVVLNARQSGAVRVEAVARADGGLSAEAVQLVTVRRAKLEVQVVGHPVRFAGSVASYEFRVQNLGDAAADNVVAEVVLPPGAKISGRQSVSGRTIVRELGSISQGSERTFSVDCQLTNPGENVVEVRAKAAGNMVAAKSFVTQVRTLADLKLTVNDPPGPIGLNQDTVYDLTIVNRGTRAARDVQIIAQFSEGVEPVDSSGTNSKLVPGQVLFEPIPRIDPGEEVRLRITAKASLAGNHRFRAEVRCAEPETYLVEEETTYFFGETSTAQRESSGSGR